MKKIIYIILGFIVISSCEKDENKVTVAENLISAEFTSPSDGSAFVLTEAEKDVFFTATWSHADYGFPTVISYIIQMDTIGGTFKKPQMFGATINDTTEVKYSDLNTKLVNLKLDSGETKDMRLRIRAIINEYLDTLYSSEIKIKLTAY